MADIQRRPGAALRSVALLPLLAFANLAEAAPEIPPRLWQRCYEAVPWFHAAELPAEDVEGRLQLLAGTPGGFETYSRAWIGKALREAPSIDDCLAEAGKRRKLLFWYVPAVEGQHVILPHLLDRYMMVGPLSDPDVTGLLERRFLSIKLPGGGELAKRFALASPGFVEPGFLVLRPDGTVLHRMDRIYTFDAGFLRAQLQHVLDEHGREAGHSRAYTDARLRLSQDPLNRDRIAFARHAIWEGEPRRARHALDFVLNRHIDKGKDEARLVLANLLRIQRDARGAHLALAGLGDSRFAGEARVLSARVHLGDGRVDLAERALEPGLLPEASKRRQAELAWLRGICRYARRDETGAEAAWRRAVAADRGSIWAAKAAAHLLPGTDTRPGESALRRGMLDPRWMHPDVYRAARDTQWRRKRHDVQDILQGGVSFLLRRQRSSGRWRGFRWGQPESEVAGTSKRPDSRNDNIDVAIAAVCARALRTWRPQAREAIDEALVRADRFLLEAKVHREEAICWVYADAFRLAYFALRQEDLAERERAAVRTRMRAWIRHLRKHQEENAGSFRHFVYKSTFVTAAVAASLHTAREAGVKVPGKMFAEAAEVLAKARGGPQGLYGYLLDNPAVTRTERGAGNRQPLCEWVAYITGEADATRLRSALGIFLDAYPKSAAIARKCNFHIPALDHTAGYYFFHNFRAACVAARHTGEDAKANLGRLLDLLCALPEIDGSFIDCGFSYGKSYSTAMALLSLKALIEPLPR